jgi:hypothetical protein
LHSSGVLLWHHKIYRKYIHSCSSNVLKLLSVFIIVHLLCIILQYSLFNYCWSMLIVSEHLDILLLLCFCYVVINYNMLIVITNYYPSMVLPYPLGLLRVCSDCVLCTIRWLVLFLRKCLTIYIYCINVVIDVTCIFVVCNFQKKKTFLHSYSTASVIQSVFTGIQKLRKGRLWPYECPLKIIIIQNGRILLAADAILDSNNQFLRFSSKLFQPIGSELTDDRFLFYCKRDGNIC